MDMSTLLEERDRLLARKANLKAQRKQSTEQGGSSDPLDAVDPGLFVREETIACINRQLSDIEVLLKQGENVRTCCKCGREIPSERVAAFPSALRCVSCQEDHDREKRISNRESHPGSGHRKPEVSPAYCCSI